MALACSHENLDFGGSHFLGFRGKALGLLKRYHHVCITVDDQYGRK